MNSPKDAASALREQALDLLRQAQALDGKEPLVFIHEHRHGQTAYVGLTQPGLLDTQDEVIEWAERIMARDDVRFDEDDGESLTFFGGDISLEDICGVPHDDLSDSQPKP